MFHHNFYCDFVGTNLMIESTTFYSTTNNYNYSIYSHIYKCPSPTCKSLILQHRPGPLVFDKIGHVQSSLQQMSFYHVTSNITIH